MMCDAVEVWSLSLLVGAFLDLVISFLLLCAAAAAYSSSKFLAALGLRLPCPCDGLFGRPSGRCVWRDVSERTVEKVASVQVSVASRFPFGLMMMRGREDDDVGDGKGCAGPGCEGSLGSKKGGSSIGDADGGFGGSFRGVGSNAAKMRQTAIKGKGVFNLRRRSGLGLRRRRNIFSCSLCDAQIARARIICSSSSLKRSCSNHKIGGASPSRFILVPDDVSKGKTNLSDVRAEEESQSTFAKAVDCFSETEKNEIKNVDWANVGNSCRFVEESVTESVVAAKAECAGCASLRLELEKERNSAATAADEAMAMIMRLQKEKASVDMEAKQYQRVIEEKSPFDAEEMNILKEILLRRERENHFLEKEVQAYRQIAFTNEQLENGLLVYASVQKPVISSSTEDDVESIQTAESINGSNDDVQEKGGISCGRTLSVDDGGPLNSNEPLSASSELSSHEVEESIVPPERLGERNGDGSLDDVFSDNMKDAHSDTLDISLNSSSLSAEPCIHDVHVVGFVPSEDSRNKDGQENRSAINPSSNLNRKRSDLLVDGAGSRLSSSSSSSDLTSRMQVVCCSHRRTVPTNFRRNSMSAVDYERVKIDDEVERLTQRLKMVQEGREKLKICRREWGSGSQLSEIQQLKEPGDCEHLDSLPPLSSEVRLKKRRWLSVSMGRAHRSS